jgi:hypothetical protein
MLKNAKVEERINRNIIFPFSRRGYCKKELYTQIGNMLGKEFRNKFSVIFLFLSPKFPQATKLP